MLDEILDSEYNTSFEISESPRGIFFDVFSTILKNIDSQELKNNMIQVNKMYICCVSFTILIKSDDSVFSR